jgi:ABC-type Fe3+/spermidine/putrescine transport system ATPase subunit
MTVRKNLAFAAKVPRLERHRRVGEMLERFELTEAAGRRPGEIRAAERLRAAAARALIAAPKLLLVDAADFTETHFHQVRTWFEGPVVIATRDLDLACALSDQLLVLDSGRILRRGAPREVLDQPQSVQAARLLGYSNLFEATITGLDPGRSSSRLQIESAAGSFELAGPYLPGHFRGDRISIGIRSECVRVYGAAAPALGNAQPAQLLRVLRHVSRVRLEFAGGIAADLPPDEYARQKDNKNWLVEFPSEALRIL